MKKLVSGALILAACGLGGQSASIAAAAHPPEDGDYFNAVVTEQFAYDDNLFRIPSGQQFLESLVGPGASRQDKINTLSAGVEGQWTLGRQAIALDAHASDNRYTDNTRLNNTSALVSAMWDWRAGTLWTGQLGTTFTRGLANFQNINFYGRDIVDTIQNFGNANFQLSPHWNLFGGFSQTTATQSVESQKPNDFNGRSGNVGVRYITAGDRTFGVNYEYSDGRYPHDPIVEFQDVEFNRNYKTNTTRFLVSIPIGSKTVFDANVGYEKRDYPSSSIGSFSGDIWRGILTWTPAPKTQVIFNAWHQVTAYLDAESLFFNSKGYSITPTWTPTDKVTVSLAASTEKQNYLGPDTGVADFISRQDRVTGEQIAIAYAPRQYLGFKITYSLQQRSSDVARFEYDDRIISASITGRFL